MIPTGSDSSMIDCRMYPVGKPSSSIKTATSATAGEVRHVAMPASRFVLRVVLLVAQNRALGDLRGFFDEGEFGERQIPPSRGQALEGGAVAAQGRRDGEEGGVALDRPDQLRVGDATLLRERGERHVARKVGQARRQNVPLQRF